MGPLPVPARDTPRGASGCAQPCPLQVRESQYSRPIRRMRRLGAADKPATVQGAKVNPEEEKYSERWQPYSEEHWQDETHTAVPLTDLKRLAERVATVPEDFVLCKPVQNIMNARKKMASGDIPVDWGMAEMLVYASLLDAGVPVRFTGEDSRRGTFYHRHAFLFDAKTIVDAKSSAFPEASFAIEFAVIGANKIISHHLDNDM